MKSLRYLVPLLLLCAQCRGRASAPRTEPADARAVVVSTVDASARDAQDAPPTRVAEVAGSTPSGGCVPVSGALESVGRNAIVTSLTLRAVTAPSPAVLVAWAVPPLRARGGDDLALASLSADLRTVTMLDPEEPSNAQGLRRSPLSVHHAFVRVRPGNPPAYAVDSDRLSRDEDGNEFVECGDLTGQLSAVDPSTDDTVPRRLLPRALAYCRTASQGTRPFVLGLTLQGPPEAPTALGFFATRSHAAPAGALPWRLPLDGSALRHARAPGEFVREHVPEGLEVLELPSGGYALAFRHAGRLHLGYLDAALRAQGSLLAVQTLGGEPGRPRLVTDGQRVLLLVADRPAGDAGAAPYTIFSTTLTPGAAPAALTALAMELPALPGPGHLFAPTAVALPDGSWVVATSAGALQSNAPEDHQQVWLRRFAADLSPRGPAVLVADGASDPRAVLHNTPAGPTVVLAMASGHSQHRTVRLRAYTCPNP